MNATSLRFRQVIAAGLLAAAASAGATDVARARVPSDITDGVVQIAQRRLHLPPGHWVLAARVEVETVGRKQRTSTGVQAWIARVDDGQLGALMKLSLPTEDFQNVHQTSENRCPEEDGIQKADLSENPRLPECLGIYGHRDLAQAMAAREPAVLAWMTLAKVANPGPVVRFTYRQRTDFSYGGISLYLPTSHFESDDVAVIWANRVRDTCRPLFEGRSRDAELPNPPTAPTAPTTGEAPAN